jgi:SAM-dependent methyltransferase
MFDEEYYKQVYNVNDLNKLDQHWWSNYFYSKIILKYCNNKDSNILELGCGSGGILNRIENKFNTYGIEISPYALSKAQKFCKTTKLFLYDVEEGLNYKFKDVFFDVILARYVFEHLKNPKKVIVDCSLILKKGGLLIIAVPNTSFCLRRFKGEEWHGVKDKTHISLKDPQEWIQDVKDAGLKISKIFGDGCWDIPYFRGISKIFQYPLLLPTIIEIITVIPFIPLRWGENLILIAQK